MAHGVLEVVCAREFSLHRPRTTHRSVFRVLFRVARPCARLLARTGAQNITFTTGAGLWTPLTNTPTMTTWRCPTIRKAMLLNATARTRFWPTAPLIVVLLVVAVSLWLGIVNKQRMRVCGPNRWIKDRLRMGDRASRPEPSWRLARGYILDMSRCGAEYCSPCRALSANPKSTAWPYHY